MKEGGFKSRNFESGIDAEKDLADIGGRAVAIITGTSVLTLTS